MPHTANEKTAYSQLQWFHWVIVLSSLVLTFSAWFFANQQLQEKQMSQFRHQSEQIIKLLKERMNHYEDALRSGVSMIQINDSEVDVNRWRIFSQTLSIETRYPGINGMGVIYYVAPEQLEEYMAWQRVLRPDYTIHPKHNKDEFWPITYIEPVDINRKAVGLDMAHESNRFNAAKTARDSGSPQMTAPIVLVQDARKTPGFLLFLPYYTTQTPPASVEQRKSEFRGLVYAPFIMNKLMDGALENRNRLVNFSIHDQSDLLYDEFNEMSEEYDATPLYSSTSKLSIYGREWVFNVRTSTLFREQNSSNQPAFILIGGLLIDALLLGLFITMSRANKLTTEYANKVTKDLSNNQKILKDAHQKLTSAMNSMIDSLLIIDQDGWILDCNIVTETMFGYSRDKLLKIKITELFKDKTRVLELLQSEVRFSRLSDGEAKTAEGNVIPVEATIMKMEDTNNRNNKAAYTSIIRDISQRKVAELAKEQFVSTVSHELRTPLTSIKGGIGLVLGLEKDNIPDASYQMLLVAYRNVERLSKLIEDLLSLEQLNTGNMSFDFGKVDLIKVLDTSIEDCHSYLIEQKVAIRTNYCAENAVIYGDGNRLSQVFINVMSNAIKFSHTNNEVEIGLINHGDYYRITISDKGEGIPESFRKNIFNRFSQADSSDTRKNGGTGLGLNISKAIIDRHGGLISFSTKLGSGTTFYIDLPMANFADHDT
jgi:PAS domain S-box-containing protein